MTSRFNLPRASFLGYDELFSDIEKFFDRGADNYPPYNIVVLDDTHRQIEIAVAGFKDSEISVTLEKGHNLVVSGDHVSQGREFVHRGISTKKFTRKFKLAENVVVTGANLADGLLVIDLKVEIPEEEQPRQIKIETR